MGSFPSKKRKQNPGCEKNLSRVTEKVRLLREEVKEMMQERKAYQRELMVYALKEAEWKQERKRLREEVSRLKKEKMKESLGEKEKNNKEKLNLLLERSLWVKQMRKEEEERAKRRDETVEKWKQLYLTIKNELDHLILRTTHSPPPPPPGDGQCRRTEEEENIEELRRQLKEKEESIEALKEKLESMEVEESRKQRDIDILRQSLRIIKSCNNKKKKSRTGRNFSGSFLRFLDNRPP